MAKHSFDDFPPEFYSRNKRPRGESRNRYHFSPRSPTMLVHNAPSHSRYSGVLPSSQHSKRTSFLQSHRGQVLPKEHKQPDKLKQSYPRELTDMFEALECKLCYVEFTAPIVAKMHYSGKQHLKKVKLFLQAWSLRTGRPIPDVGEIINITSASGLGFYCQVCDVKLLSVNEKVLHYSSKTHLWNEKNPGNVRKRKKAYETLFCSDFNSDMFEGIDTSDEIVSLNENWCKLCDVRAISFDQLHMHLSGKKHKEKLEKRNREPNPNKRFYCKLCDVGLETRRLWYLHLNGKRHAKSLLKVDLNSANASSCKVDQMGFREYQDKMHEKKRFESVKMISAVSEGKCSNTCKNSTLVGNLDEPTCDQSLLQTNVEAIENKWICHICHNMTFDSKEKYNEHKMSRRHALSVFNQEGGDLMIAELEHWYCFICKTQYRNNKDFTNHLFEDKHLSLSNSQATLESMMDLYKCDLCNLFMEKEAKDEHSKDARHIKKALSKITINTLSKLANEEVITNNYECGNCDMVFTSFIIYSDHLLSARHLDNLVKSELI